MQELFCDLPATFILNQHGQHAEPKNLKKDIALEEMFDKLHARFQTEGGEI
jgi:hypothetical protein